MQKSPVGLGTITCLILSRLYAFCKMKIFDTPDICRREIMNTEMIEKKEAKQQVILALRRLAIYHATMVDVLEKELGREKGADLAKKVADAYGESIGLAARQATLDEGLELTPENYSEDLPMLGFEAEQVSTDPPVSRVYNCPLSEVWKEMGKEKQGMIYCRVDQAKYEAYSEGLTCLHATHCLRDQTDHCDIKVIPRQNSKA